MPKILLTFDIQSQLGKSRQERWAGERKKAIGDEETDLLAGNWFVSCLFQHESICKSLSARVHLIWHKQISTFSTDFLWLSSTAELRANTAAWIISAAAAATNFQKPSLVCSSTFPRFSTRSVYWLDMCHCALSKRE